MNSEPLVLSGPVGFRRFHLERKCDTANIHEHNYDHSLLVLKGRVLVTVYDQFQNAVWSQEYGWGERCPVAAGTVHMVKSLEDEAVFDCEFSHRDFDGIVSQRYVGNQLAYV